MGSSTIYFSRNELEQMAKPVIDQYKQQCVPQYHMVYNVDPTALAEMLGYKVEYAYLTQDGSILGQTASVPLWTTVVDPTIGKTYYFLDGNTILIDKRLLCNPNLIGRRNFTSPRNVGRKNFTIAHELAHLLLNQRYSVLGDTQYRHCYYNRQIVKKKVTDWYEWQADVLATALLLPPEALDLAMFWFGLGSKMKVLSRKY